MEQDTAVKLNDHDHEIKSLKHRVGDLEDQNKTIQELVLSVRELAINMKNMIEEQKEQGTRISMLEKEPAGRLTQIKTAIISALATALVGGIIGMILKFAG